MKGVHQRILTGRNMHLLFYEQAVCRKGIKTENGLLDDCGQ